MSSRAALIALWQLPSMPLIMVFLSAWDFQMFQFLTWILRKYYKSWSIPHMFLEMRKSGEPLQILKACQSRAHGLISEKKLSNTNIKDRVRGLLFWHSPKDPNQLLWLPRIKKAKSTLRNILWIQSHKRNLLTLMEQVTLSSEHS